MFIALNYACYFLQSFVVLNICTTQDFYHKYVTEKGNTIYKMSNIMLMLTAMLPPIEDKPVSFGLLL